jgi:DNA repair exonuclease SbcCD nuclease subunit
MKILCIGDVHIKNDNLSMVDLFLTRIKEYLQNNPVDLVVCLGDVLHYHDKVYTHCLNKATMFFKTITHELDIPLIVLVGNHDMIGPLEFLSTNHWMNSFKSWKNLTIVDTVKQKVINGYTLTFCPYVENGRFIQALDTVSDWKKSSIVFCHQEIKGVVMGPIISVLGDEWDLNFPQLVAGHIHERQEPQSNVHYTGSSLQQSYSRNVCGKTCSLIELNGLNIVKTIVDFNLPIKYIIDVDTKELNTVEINPLHYVKLSITGTCEEFKTFKKTRRYKELSENKRVKFVFKNTDILKKPLVSTHEYSFLNNLNSLIENDVNAIDVKKEFINFFNILNV